MVEVQSVMAGSIIVQFTMRIPADAPGGLETAYCAVKTGVIGATLTQALITVGGSLYASVNAELTDLSGCESCACPDPAAGVPAEATCSTGQYSSDLNKCIEASPICQSGRVLVEAGCNNTVTGVITKPGCASGTTLQVRSGQTPVCVKNATQSCPPGYLIGPTSTQVLCQLDCPDGSYYYDQISNTCAHNVTCPSGTVFDDTKGVRQRCVDIDECQSTSCLNSGTCTNIYGSYTCTCKSPHQGVTCELNNAYCLQNPNACGDHGACQPGTTALSFSCLCAKGYSGQTCQKGEAAASSASAAPAAAGGVVGGIIVLIIVIIVIVVIQRRKRQPVTAPTSSKMKDWEIPERLLTLHEVLGLGYFGLVYRADYKVNTLFFLCPTFLNAFRPPTTHSPSLSRPFPIAVQMSSSDDSSKKSLLWRALFLIKTSLGMFLVCHCGVMNLQVCWQVYETTAAVHGA